MRTKVIGIHLFRNAKCTENHLFRNACERRHDRGGESTPRLLETLLQAAKWMVMLSGSLKTLKHNNNNNNNNKALLPAVGG